MANWLSTKSVAEKYGIPKEQIREWIRLRYLTCSSIGTEPYEDNNERTEFSVIPYSFS